MNGQGHNILIITLIEMTFNALGREKLKIRHQNFLFSWTLFYPNIYYLPQSSEEERTFTFVQKIISRRGEMNF